MNGSNLVELSSIAKLAKVEISPRDIHLRSDGDYLYATYAGIYSSGTVKIEYSLHLPPCAVRPDQLLGIASLFDADDEILLTPKDTTLSVSTSKGGSKADLRLVGNPQDVADIVEGEFLFECDYNKGKQEAELAANFCSTSPQMPILTGIRISSTPDKKGLIHSSYDGKSGFYLGVSPVPQGDILDITVPPNDLTTAYEILNEKVVRFSGSVGVDGAIRRLSLSTPTTIISIPVLNGIWPKLAALMKPVDRTPIVFPTAKLATVLQAIKALAATESITLYTEQGTLFARTQESELGSFATSLAEGLPPLNVTVDSYVLRMAAKLGQEVTMGLPPDSSPVLFQSGGRRFWAPVKARNTTLAS